MTGVGCRPDRATRSCQASWSSIRVAKATWWTVPAPDTRRPLVRRRVVVQLARALLAGHAPVAVAEALEAERAGQQVGARLGVGRVGADRGEALQRVLGGDVGRRADERALGPGVDLEDVAQPLGVGEGQPVAVALGGHALGRQPLLPEGDRLGRADPPDDRVDHPVAGAPGPGAGVLEERQVRPRRALLVGVEEVVDGRVVLVDRALDEPQPERARVELDVARRIAGDGGDVVDPLELHQGANATPPGRAPWPRARAGRAGRRRASRRPRRPARRGRSRRTR